MFRIFTKIMYCSLFVVVICAAGPASAQTGQGTLIRGQVLDQATGEPVIGATVVEKDDDNRTVTGVAADLDGNFAIRVKDLSHTLEISSMGFVSQVIPLTPNMEALTVQLESSLEQIEEVMISVEKTPETGLLNIAERNLTTSQVTIDASEVEDSQAASIDEALQGRIPGVDISANSGDPGAGMQIRIRGTSSITGSSDPLVVVDGMPFDTSIPEDFNFGTADQENYAALINIAPSDIESITILKDAAATAMWGSRAASGVLVINTKRGSVGKPVVNYTFRGTLSGMPEPILMLTGDQYSSLIPELYMNANGVPLDAEDRRYFQFDPQQVYWYENYSKNTNWIDAVSAHNPLGGEHTLSLQGGGEKARYYTSVGYYNSRGVTKGTSFDRLTTRINLDYIVSDRIRFKADMSYTHSTRESNYDNIRSVAYVKMPNMSIYEYDEFGNLTPNFFSPAENIQGEYDDTYNPLAMAEFAQDTEVGERIIPHFSLDFDLVPSLLTTRFDIQFDINNNKRNTFLPQLATGLASTDLNVNRATDSDRDAFSMTTKSNFIYTPTIGEDHSLQGILSLQTSDRTSVVHQVESTNSASSLLTDPSVPAYIQDEDLEMRTRMVESRSVGALVNFQYGFLDRYLINVGVRGDGSSRFGPDNRYGVFPSVSARWRASSESFLNDLEFLDDLSFRASWGQSGRAPEDDYRYFNNYVTSETGYLGLSGVYPQNIQLSSLRWETLTGKNLGLNLRMFDERVMVDVDLYHNRTTDLMFEELDITTVSGYSEMDLNGGTLDNQGWEVGLYTTPYKSDNLRVEFNFNISRNENIIREISEFYPNEEGNVDEPGEFKRFLLEDNPFGAFYGYRFKGVYTDEAATLARDANGDLITGPNGQAVRMRFFYPQIGYVFQPGDAMYEDINHDGNIDSRDVVYLGNSNPKFIGGFGPSVTINQRIKLSAFFNFRVGYDIVNATDMYTTNMEGFDNQSAAVMKRWRNPGDITDMPRAVFGSNNYNWLGSDRYVQDASFLRFRTATVSYSFGDGFLEKVNFKDFRMYLTADNIMTFTNYRGQDPEVSMRGGDPFGIAEDDSRTPPTRRFTLGIQATF